MKFKIFDNTFQIVEIATLAMPLPIQYSCALIYLPIKILNEINEGVLVYLFLAWLMMMNLIVPKL